MTGRHFFQIPLLLLLVGTVGAGPALADDVFSYDKNVLLIERALSKGDCGQAIQAAERLVNNAPQDVEALTHLFRAWQCGGECNQPERLIESADKMLSLDDSNLLGHEYRIKALRCQEDCAALVVSYERFVELGGDGTTHEEAYRACRGEVVDLVLPQTCNEAISVEVVLDGKPHRSLRWGDETRASTKGSLVYRLGGLATYRENVPSSEEGYLVVPPGGVVLGRAPKDKTEYELVYSVGSRQSPALIWGPSSETQETLLGLPVPSQVQISLAAAGLGTAKGEVALSSCQVLEGVVRSDNFPSIAARTAWEEQKKKEQTPRVLAVAGLLGGAPLAVAGGLQRLEARGFAEEAANAQVGASYEEKVAAGNAANTRFAALTGAGAALLTAGVVGVILAGLQSQKTKAAKARYEALLKEPVDLDTVIDWND